MLRATLAALLLFASLPAFGAESLTVSTIERKPFSFQTEQGWDGFSIELLELAAERLDWTLTYRSSESFPEMLDAVKSGQADIAAANISITYNRESEMDFSQPIFDAGLVVLAPIDGGAGIFEVLFSRDLLMWVGGAIILLFAAGALIFRIEGKTSEVKDVDYDDGKIGGVGEGVWWAVNIVTQAGFEIPSPKSRSGRLLAFALILTGLFAVSAFVAQITAALTVSELSSQVSGLQDLYGKRVGTTEASTSAEYLDSQSLPYRGYASVDEMLEALEKGELDAVVHDAPILAYYAANDGKGRYQLAGRIFKPEKYGFALFEGHQVMEGLDRTILQLREDGSYDQLLAKWFGSTY